MNPFQTYKITTVDYGESETPGKETVYLCYQTYPNNPKNFTTLDDSAVLIVDGDWVSIATTTGPRGICSCSSYKKGYFTVEEVPGILR